MGYWGAVTSTLDWCERNYVVTQYVAEFWNTFSSFLIALGGVIALFWMARSPWPVRYRWLAWWVIAVGLGSALFHGTLKFHMQLLDELPMVYSMLCWLYLWYYNLKRMGGMTLPRTVEHWLVPGLTAYGVLWTVLHGLLGFTVAFQVHFAILVTMGFSCVVVTCRLFPRRRVWRAAALYMGGTVLAFVFWIIDKTQCDFMNSLPINPQFHAWWHTLIAFSTYQSLLVITSAETLAVVASHHRNTNKSNPRSLSSQESVLAVVDKLGVPRSEPFEVPGTCGFVCVPMTVHVKLEE